jgi:hypothetical protein
MADVEVQARALEAARQRVDRFRGNFDQTGTEIKSGLGQLASNDLVFDGNDSVTAVGTRFSQAFEKTALTLGNLAQWLQKVQQDYATRAAESKAGFDGISPGGG